MGISAACPIFVTAYSLYLSDVSQLTSCYPKNYS